MAGNQHAVRLQSPLFQDSFWKNRKRPGLRVFALQNIEDDVLVINDFGLRLMCAHYLRCRPCEAQWSPKILRRIIQTFTRIPAQRLVFDEAGRELDPSLDVDFFDCERGSKYTKLARSYDLRLRIRCPPRRGAPGPGATPLDRLPDCALGACVDFCEPEAVVTLAGASQSTRRRLVAEKVVSDVFVRFYRAPGLDDAGAIFSSHNAALLDWTKTRGTGVLCPVLALAFSRGAVADGCPGAERERTLASRVRWTSCARTYASQIPVRHAISSHVVVDERVEVHLDASIYIIADVCFAWTVFVHLRAGEPGRVETLTRLRMAYGDAHEPDDCTFDRDQCDLVSSALALPGGPCRLMKFLGLVLAGPHRWAIPEYDVGHESVMLCVLHELEREALAADMRPFDQPQAAPRAFTRFLWASSESDDSGWWSRYADPAVTV